VSGRRRRNRQIIPQAQPRATQSTSLTQVQAEFFSGPIPPPSYLARYNDVVPNGADRIISMAEKQSTHRESLEKQVVEGNLTAQSRGQIEAFILALIVILGGIYLMATGKSGWGFAAIISSLAALVSIFALGKREQKNERVDKANALANRRGR
jgi:uncharacterized membrane protein